MTGIFSNLFNMFSGNKNNPSDKHANKTKKTFQLFQLDPSNIFIFSGHNVDHNNIVLYSCQFADCVNKAEIYCDNQNLVNDYVKNLKQYNKNIIFFNQENNQNNGIILLTQKSIDNVQESLNNAATVIYCYQENGVIDKKHLYFVPNTNEEHVQKLLQQGIKVVGFSTSKKYDDKVISSNTAIAEENNKKSYDYISEADLLQAITSNNINFNHIASIFQKIPQLANNPLLQRFNIDIFKDKNTMEAVKRHSKQTIKIIDHMTEEERENPRLLTISSSSDVRINRIAQESSTSIESVNQVIKIHDMLKNNSGNIINMMKDPSKISELIENFKK